MADLIDPLSDFLRKPGHVCRPTTGPDDLGCAGGFVRLNLLQTQALVEFHDTGGLFLQGPLGCGKTGVSVLAPTLLGAERALLIIPGGGGRRKTLHEIAILREHWNIVPFGLASYQKLARETQEFFFFEPPGPYDCIILDEAHFCKNQAAAVTKRITRLHDNAGQEITVTNIVTGRTTSVQVPATVPMAVMTATPVKDSINDCGHTMEWALGDHSPLPRVQSELDDWAGALDAEPAERFEPGALVVFSGGSDVLENVRKGVGNWIFDTPGCISSSESYVSAQLHIHLRNVQLTPVEDAWFRVLRGDPDDYEEYPGWTTPDGDIFTDAAELWRHACSMGLGYFTKWDPAAPSAWRLARYNINAGVREVLSVSRTLDTRAQVTTAIDHGQYPHLKDYLDDWRAIEPTFTPNTVPVWVGDTALKYAMKWLGSGGIVWTGHTFFGRRLSELTGCPYFGAKGLTETGESIVHTNAPGIIASVGANGVMHNLQRYNRNLIASIWPVGYTVEQCIGRTHRQGQRRDVTVDWMISCREQLNGYARAASSHGPFMRDLMQVPSRLCGAQVASEHLVTSGWAFREQE